ncbi:MAG: methyltransferase domain-containing protein [Oscillospiraceae bacterium]|nr:methyltransferase domain-containing protein [Oscillospiraceae bacterium]
MDKERADALRKEWEAEEEIAHIHGWDFSHIHGKYSEEDDLPWDYEQIVNEYRTPDMKMLDYDTGGGEFLLSLKHPYENTAATEGYPPNVEICKEVLLPLGIDFRECADESHIPFDGDSFDLFINRHGSFDPEECCRVLRPGGLFITEQVGSENDRDLVKLVLPDLPKPFSDLKLDIQGKKFEEAGFELLRAEEAFRPIIFYDIGAFVWFAHIIEWEFTGFSVDRCFDKLLELQEEIDRNGKIEGTIHRYLIVARKKG